MNLKIDYTTIEEFEYKDIAKPHVLILKARFKTKHARSYFLKLLGKFINGLIQ